MTRRLVTALALPFLLASAAPGADLPPKDVPAISLHVVLSDLEPTRERDLRRAELFWAGVSAEWKRNCWGARAELRGKDGRFRPYYGGDVWLQEGYAFLETGWGEVRVGKLERAFSPRDETFGGDLFSLNGVTRNPDWGAGLSGSMGFGFDTLSWDLRTFGRNDRVAWEEEGRGVESDGTASLRDGFEARVAYVINRQPFSIQPAISAASSRIVREGGLPGFRRTDLSADLTASLGPPADGPIAVWIQGFYRSGEAAAPSNPLGRLGYDDAWAGRFGFRAGFPTVIYRYTYTEWRYRGADANERIHQPAVVWIPAKGIEATIEYGARRLRNPTGARAYNVVRLGLALAF